jgi:chitodextrinase
VTRRRKLLSLTLLPLAALGAATSAAVAADLTSADTTPPTVPGPVTAEALSATSVRLTWGRSTDDVGVAYYRVTRNGSVVATTDRTSLVDRSLRPGTRYEYALRAYDAAGNASAVTRVPVTTLAVNVRFGKAAVNPAVPRAGAPLYVAVQVFVESGEAEVKLRAGKVRCSATSGGSAIASILSKVVPGRGVQCGWRVPLSARGKTLVAAIVVSSGGGSATKTYRWPVR